MMKHRKALITGGTRGIGAATASKLLAAGYEVTVTGSSDGTSRPAGSAYIQCDFSNPDDVQRLAEGAAGQGFSILVNNAGVNKIGPVEEYSVDDFQRIQQINVAAPFALCKALVPDMRRNRYGRIVNVTSIFGIVSKAGRSAYSASKFGLLGLSRALALEVAADNVLVNCIAPGFVDTELTRGILGVQGMEQMARQVPAGRFASPEEIARYIVFLASEENTYMTGQTLVADGGYTSA